MAIECPDCRTITGNDDAPYCSACGREFYKIKPRQDTGWQILALCIAIGALLTFLFVQRRC